MNKKTRLFTLPVVILYILYVVLCCAIIAFVLQNVVYGMFEMLIRYFGILSVWIWGFIAIIVLSSPIYLHKLIKTAWKVPLIAIVITSLAFSVWFFMMWWAVTAK